MFGKMILGTPSLLSLGFSFVLEGEVLTKENIEASFD